MLGQSFSQWLVMRENCGKKYFFFLLVFEKKRLKWKWNLTNTHVDTFHRGMEESLWWEKWWTCMSLFTNRSKEKLTDQVGGMMLQHSSFLCRVQPCYRLGQVSVTNVQVESFFWQHQRRRQCMQSCNIDNLTSHEKCLGRVHDDEHGFHGSCGPRAQPKLVGGPRPVGGEPTHVHVATGTRMYLIVPVFVTHKGVQPPPLRIKFTPIPYFTWAEWESTSWRSESSKFNGEFTKGRLLACHDECVTRGMKWINLFFFMRQKSKINRPFAQL